MARKSANQSHETRHTPTVVRPCSAIMPKSAGSSRCPTALRGPEPRQRCSWRHSSALRCARHPGRMRCGGTPRTKLCEEGDPAVSWAAENRTGAPPVPGRARLAHRMRIGVIEQQNLSFIPSATDIANNHEAIGRGGGNDNAEMPSNEALGDATMRWDDLAGGRMERNAFSIPEISSNSAAVCGQNWQLSLEQFPKP